MKKEANKTPGIVLLTAALSLIVGVLSIIIHIMIDSEVSIPITITLTTASFLMLAVCLSISDDYDKLIEKDREAISEAAAVNLCLSKELRASDRDLNAAKRRLKGATAEAAALEEELERYRGNQNPDLLKKLKEAEGREAVARAEAGVAAAAQARIKQERDSLLKDYKAASARHERERDSLLKDYKAASARHERELNCAKIDSDKRRKEALRAEGKCSEMEAKLGALVRAHKAELLRASAKARGVEAGLETEVMRHKSIRETREAQVISLVKENKELKKKLDTTAAEEKELKKKLDTTAAEEKEERTLAILDAAVNCNHRAKSAKDPKEVRDLYNEKNRLLIRLIMDDPFQFFVNEETITTENWGLTHTSGERIHMDRDKYLAAAKAASENHVAEVGPARKERIAKKVKAKNNRRRPRKSASKQGA